MPASADVQLVGLKEAIRSLNKIEPGLRKEFTKDAGRIAEPAIRAVQQGYTGMRQSEGAPLSGMNNNWTQDAKKIFPFSMPKALRGVKLKVDASLRATSLIYITQTDRAAAIFESAGRTNQNLLGDSLGSIAPGRTRILGPAVYKARPQIEGEMEKAALAVIRRVEKELN